MMEFIDARKMNVMSILNQYDEELFGDSHNILPLWLYNFKPNDSSTYKLVLSLRNKLGLCIETIQD